MIHTDDFATGEAGDEWWPRLESQLINPLVAGRIARYQRYDWDRRVLAEWHEIRPAPAVLIEGVSSAHRAVAERLTLAVWVHARRAVRLARGLQRDGEAARSVWERWMSEEDDHFRFDETIARCEILVDGSPELLHDPERQFVRLASCAHA